MAIFPHLSPVPSFPAYSGPYSVGSKYVEIPTSELSSFSTPPDPHITSISFRLFYPCQKEPKSKPIYWLPDPQKEYSQAYFEFLSAKPFVAKILTWLPFLRLMQWATIPGERDANILQPPAKNNGGWPVMVFSHGLGGTANAYSQICGSIASHGMVVVAPDHRDGSAPIAFIKDTPQGKLKAVDCKQYAHDPSSKETQDGRNAQLKIRCWELGLVHNALLRIDRGQNLTNTQGSVPSNNLNGFRSQLDVHAPGKISWSGHSFGATTLVQFLKSSYYGGSFLYPRIPEELSRQITSASPMALLDLWSMPLTGPAPATMYKQPLPAFCGSPSSPPLAILSKGFYRWKDNFEHTLHTLTSPSADAKPYIFYPIASAHLSQSDFGLLFPWLTKKALKAEEPDRTLRLNTRAILEYLRRSEITIADTSKLDMEIEGDQEGKTQAGLSLGQDRKILASDGNVRGWTVVDVDEEKRKLGLSHNLYNDGFAHGGPKVPGEAVMKHEMKA